MHVRDQRGPGGTDPRGAVLAFALLELAPRHSRTITAATIAVSALPLVQPMVGERMRDDRANGR
jgi:hypothetical protein